MARATPLPTILIASRLVHQSVVGRNNRGRRREHNTDRNRRSVRAGLAVNRFNRRQPKVAQWQNDGAGKVAGSVGNDKSVQQSASGRITS